LETDRAARRLLGDHPEHVPLIAASAHTLPTSTESLVAMMLRVTNSATSRDGE
jgi:hypothetical protein